MDLTRKQFELLSALAGPEAERALPHVPAHSPLRERGLLGPDGITAEGRAALEPYRARRAVFLAAGFGARLSPITLNTPKPLVRVHGVRMIDTLLDAVTAAGIGEIVVVRGYLGEQFDALRYRYPQIRFVDNPLYREANNISSALLVRELLENAYVFEADLLLHNPRLVTPYQYRSNYLGVPVERSDDWCFTVRDGVIRRMAVGGKNCYHMFGVSYWNAPDGRRLSEHLRLCWERPGGRQLYWDQAALEVFRGDYRIEVRPCTFEDLTEIDTLGDLRRIDPAYRC